MENSAKKTKDVFVLDMVFKRMVDLIKEENESRKKPYPSNYSFKGFEYKDDFVWVVRSPENSEMTLTFNRSDAAIYVKWVFGARICEDRITRSNMKRKLNPIMKNMAEYIRN